MTCKWVAGYSEVAPAYLFLPPMEENFTYTIFELFKLSFLGLTLKLTQKTNQFVPQVYNKFLLTPYIFSDTVFIKH